MPANAATLPRPYLGPDRPPSANWWVRGPVLGAGPSFLGFCFCSVSGSPVGIMGQVFFFSREWWWCIDSVGARTHHRNKASRTAYTLVSSAKTELGTFPAHVPTSSPKWCGCPGPSCRLDGSCQCIRDKFPSPAAITSDRCPALPSALPGPALCWLLVAWSLLTRLAYLSARLSSLLFCFPVYCRRTSPVQTQLREAACAWPAARRVV